MCKDFNQLEDYCFGVLIPAFMLRSLLPATSDVVSYGSHCAVAH